ncbi:hypothetical protein BGY98DRAFT_269152 [Russula aff. rugulosa BPL654]|nr:hypothetical protein BGY98DRAFT_269152 [Russula aff. rugulosa BPL654]
MPTIREICVRMRVSTSGLVSTAGHCVRVRCNRRSEDPVGCGNQPQMMFNIPRTGTRIVHAVAGLEAMHTVPATCLAHDILSQYIHIHSTRHVVLARRHQIQRGKPTCKYGFMSLTTLLRALAIINKAQGGIRVFKIWVRSRLTPNANSRRFFFCRERVSDKFSETYFSDQLH